MAKGQPTAERSPGEITEFSQRDVALAHDDMVKHLDLEQLPGPNQIAGHSNVCLAGRWIAAGMIVKKNERTARNADDRLEHFTRFHRAGMETAECDQIVTDDPASGVQHQGDQRFFRRIKPVSLGNVVAPVSGNDVGRIGDLAHGLAVADIQNFELMRGVGFHEKIKRPDTRDGVSGPVGVG